MGQSKQVQPRGVPAANGNVNDGQGEVSGCGWLKARMLIMASVSCAPLIQGKEAMQGKHDTFRTLFSFNLLC